MSLTSIMINNMIAKQLNNWEDIMVEIINGKVFDTDRSQVLLDTGVIHTGPPILAMGIDYNQRIYYKSPTGIFFRVQKQFTKFFGKLNHQSYFDSLRVFQSAEECVNEMQMWELKIFSRERVATTFGLEAA